jgi:hypothetical protein
MSGDELTRTVGTLFSPGDVVELRTFKDGATYSGYFDNHQELVKAAAKHDKLGHDVYVTLNKLPEEIAYRRYNRVGKIYREPLTSDNDVARRTFLFIDADYERVAGISSTDEEKQKSQAKVLEIRDYLSGLDWPEPIVCDSGNGYHLLYPIDLPANKASLEVVAGVLGALDFKFTDDAVKVDTSTKNAARITKFYGTVAKKGDDLPQRPHRPSKLLEVPETQAPVSREQLAAIAAMKPEAARKLHVYEGGKNYKELDVAEWVVRYDVPVKREGPWDNYGYRWILEECIWNGHTDNAAYIIQGRGGWIAAGCQHNSCPGGPGDNGWPDVREHYEPGYESRGYEIQPPGQKSGPDVSDVSDVFSTQEKINVRTPAFPTDALPPICQRYVEEVAAAVLCPPELVGVPLLCAVSGAVGYTRVLRIKYGWEVSASLYAAVVSPPGARKSPAASFAYKPLEKIQAELRRDYKEEKETFDRQMRQHALDKKLAAKDGKPEPDPPLRPKMGRCIVDDITIEALAVRLEENPRGLTAVHDELTGFIRGMDQYKSGGKGNARQAYLKMWSNAPIYVDRKGSEEPVVVPKPYVTLQGGIQPAVLSEIADGRNDGFLDRFMVAYPEPRPAGYSENTVSQDAELGYRKVIERLWAKQFEQDDDGAPVPRGVSMDADAKRLFVSVANALEQEAYSAGFPEALRGPWGKFDTHLARLALIVSLARGAEEGVSKELVTAGDMRAAIRLLDYFKAATRKVYGQLFEANSDDVLAADIKAFLTKNGNKFFGTISDLLDQLDSTALPNNAKRMGRALVRIVKQAPEITIEKKSTGDKRLISLTLRETSETSETSGEEHIPYRDPATGEEVY